MLSPAGLNPSNFGTSVPGVGRLLPAPRISGSDPRPKVVARRTQVLDKKPKFSGLANISGLRLRSSRRGHRRDEVDPSAPAKVEEERLIALASLEQQAGGGRRAGGRAGRLADRQAFEWLADRGTTRRGLAAVKSGDESEPRRTPQRTMAETAPVTERRTTWWNLDEGGVYPQMLARRQVELPGPRWLAKLFGADGVEVPRFEKVVSLLRPPSSAGSSKRSDEPVALALRVVLAGVAAWSGDAATLLSASASFLSGSAALKGGWRQVDGTVHSYKVGHNQLPYGLMIM